MAQLTLCELLDFLQQNPYSYTRQVVFVAHHPRIKAYILDIFSKYRKKISFENPPTIEVKDCSRMVTIHKSLKARNFLPALSVGIVETSGLDFKEHSPDKVGWPGYSTELVVINFAKKLHSLAKLHGAKEVYYYCGFVIRWGTQSNQVIYIESDTKGTLVAPTDGEESKDTKESKNTEELISHQFMPDGHDKTLAQMTLAEKQEHHPYLKALVKVLEVLEKNGLFGDEK